jgi:hypothetical protein
MLIIIFGHPFPFDFVKTSKKSFVFPSIMDIHEMPLLFQYSVFSLLPSLQNQNFMVIAKALSTNKSKHLVTNQNNQKDLICAMLGIHCWN